MAQIVVKIAINSNKIEAIEYPIKVNDVDGTSFVYDSNLWDYTILDNGASIKLSFNINTSLYSLVLVLLNGSQVTYTESSDSDYNKILTITLGNLTEDSENTIQVNFDKTQNLIHYVSDKGTTPSDRYISNPDSLMDVDLPTLTETGYVFSGWYYDPYYQNEAEIGDYISSNIVLYAKWVNYKLIFETNGGNEIADYYGTNIPTLSGTYLPTRAKYTFSGWYEDEDFTNQAYSGTLISNIASFDSGTNTATIYAKWLTYTISYNVNGGISIASDIGVALPISLPIPLRTGYTFSGWYYDSQLTSQATGGDSINSNTTLYAKWTKIDESPIAINLYQNASEKERVDKSNYLTSVGSITGTLRQATSLTNPIIRIEYPMINFNYVYIPLFERYYYVVDVVSIVNGLWELSLSVDVLYSYKTEILQLNAYVERQATDYNPELVDSEVIAKNGSDYEFENLGRDSNFGSDRIDKSSYIFVLGGMK